MSSNYTQNIRTLDVNDIISIERESYKNPWTKNHFQNDIKNKYSLNYMYKKDNELMAYLFGHLIQDEYYLNKITVKKKYRQKKIGESLFFHCFNELSDKNVRCIQLEVSSLNLIAQEFYKSLNFIEVGKRKSYYSKNEHALLYNLEIK